MTDSLLSLVFHYGYWGLFGAMSLGIIGVPIPDELLLTASGYLLSQGHMKLGWTMLAAMSGSLIGMTLSYMVGRTVGRPLIAKYGKRVGLSPEKLERYERRFTKWGHVLVLIGYFVPGLRHATALIVGMGNHPYRPFLFYASVGALAWTSSFILLGLVLGDHWRDVTKIIQHDLVLVLVVIAVLAVAAFTWRRMVMRRRASE